MLNFADKKRAQEQVSRPLAELLPWLFLLDDQVVCCKDSGLLASFTFTGLDIDGATADQLDQAILDNITAFQRMADRPVTVWWQARKRRIRYYPRGEFPNPWTKVIEEELVEDFLDGQNYQISHSLSVLMLPNVGMDRFIDRLRLNLGQGEGGFFTALLESGKSLFSDSAAFAYTDQELAYAMGQFEAMVKEFTSSFSDIVFERLTGDRLMGFLKSAGSPVRQNYVAKPDNTWLLDGYLSDAAVVPGNNFVYLDGGSDSRSQYVSAITVKNARNAWPDQLQTGHLKKLLAAPGEITISHVFRLKPRSLAVKSAEAVRNFNRLRKFSWKAYANAATNGGSFDNAPVNPGREAMEEEAKEALGKLTVEAWAKGWYNLTVLCHSDSEAALSELSDATIEILNQSRFVAIRESLGTVSAFAGTLPGQWAEIHRWHDVTSENLGCLAPLMTIATGEPLNNYLTDHLKQTCPALMAFHTEYGVPLFANLHDGQLGHTAFIGPSRTGKSLLALLIASLFTKYPNARVLILDKDLTCRIGTLIQGGVHTDLGRNPANKIRMNPLVLLRDPKHFGWLVDFVEMLCSHRAHMVTSDERKDIENALRATEKLTDRENLRLSTIWGSLASEALKNELAPWVGQGSLAHYFDNVEDELSFEAAITCQETGQILNNENVCAPWLEYLFYRVDNDILTRMDLGIQGPMMIYIPEVFFFLKNRKFASKFADWLRTMAKRMVLLLLDTQSPDELAKSEAWAEIRDNIPTYIFTPNAKAAGQTLRELYVRQFMLSEEQIAIIVKGKRMRDYLFVQQGLSRRFSMKISGTPLAILRSETAAQIAFDRHMARGKEGHDIWIADYINEIKGLKCQESEAFDLA